MGIVLLAEGRYADHLQTGVHSFFQFRFFHACGIVEAQRLKELFTHSLRRIQRRHGVLKDHGDFIAPDSSKFLIRECQNAVALKGDVTS